MGRNDIVYVDVYVVRECDASILVENHEDGDTFLVPLSQLKDGTDVREEGDSGTIAIPRWLAEDRQVSVRETKAV